MSKAVQQGHHELIQLREVREQGGRGVGIGKQEQQVWPVLRSSSSALNLTPHRTIGVASVSPAVLVPFATPCLRGARRATSTSQPGGRRNGISSRDARLAQGGDAGHAGRAPRLDKASSGGRGAGAAVGGDRPVKRGRRTTLDGQPGGPTLAEQYGAPRTTRRGLGQRRARAGPRPQKRGKQRMLRG